MAWDGRQISRLALPWACKHWFSSSLSDLQAQEYRCASCTVAASVRDPEGPDWLADLHRSHRPFAGPYSICVHRPDAVTVSYMEVLVNSWLISMRYIAGSRCESTGFHHVLDLPRCPDESAIPGLLPDAFFSAAAFEIAASLRLLMHLMSSNRQEGQPDGYQIRNQPGKD